MCGLYLERRTHRAREGLMWLEKDRAAPGMAEVSDRSSPRRGPGCRQWAWEGEFWTCPVCGVQLATSNMELGVLQSEESSGGLHVGIFRVSVLLNPGAETGSQGGAYSVRRAQDRASSSPTSMGQREEGERLRGVRKTRWTGSPG